MKFSATNYARALKRSGAIALQICRDIEWHRRFTASDFGPLPKRIVEQAKLLIQSAICAEDYYHLALYRTELSHTEKRSFLGSFEKWRYFNRLNPPVYDIIARDKALFHVLANSLSIPTPQTLATTSPDQRPRCGLAIRNADELKQFLLSPGSEDLFFKPVDGSLGEGALSIGKFDDATQTWRLLPSNQPITVNEIATHISPKKTLGRFLIQRRLIAHPDFARIVPNVCPTVRLMTLRTETGFHVIGAALRLGSGRTPTDNVAGGGLIGPISLKTGTIEHTLSLESDYPQIVSTHPQTGVSIGTLHVPDWQRVLDLVNDSGEKLNFFPCIGWDVALTENGPLIIEINTRPRCISVQSSKRTGLLDGPMGNELAKGNQWLDSGISVSHRSS